MATRAKALKKFAKNVLHHDLTGMSETAVLKDLLKQEFNIDAVGNSVVSVLMNAAGNDGGDCKHPGAYLKLKDGVTFCYYKDTDTGDMMANMYLNGNLVEAPYSAEVLAQVCELTLDCEPLVATQGGIVSVEPNLDDENYVVTFYAGDDEGTEATTTAVAPTACE